VRNDGPKDVVEKTPKEEPLIVEPEALATSLETSTVLHVLESPKEEEILL